MSYFSSPPLEEDDDDRFEADSDDGEYDEVYDDADGGYDGEGDAGYADDGYEDDEYDDEYEGDFDGRFAREVDGDFAGDFEDDVDGNFAGHNGDGEYGGGDYYGDHRPAGVGRARRDWRDDAGSAKRYSVGTSAPYRPRHIAGSSGGPPTGELESFKVMHRRPSWVLWMVGAVALLLVILGIGVIVVRHDINPGHPGPLVSVTIPKGASTDEIGSILGKAGVIDSSSVFHLYTKVNGVGVLLPGTYHLHRSSSYSSAIAALEAGPPVVYQKFTIPEGFTLAQIADRVGGLPGRSASAFLAAANSGQVQSQLQPAGQTSLEGLLFPATYTVRADASDISIVQTMVQTFDDNIANLNLTQAAAAVGVTPYQVVVVASMVEREAKLDEDRGPIASVIYNRLKANMLLQIDATVLYGEGITDPSKMDKNSNSPYNTYKFKGLPPTPIASPGLPSLTAAANPPKTNYFYYVVIDSTGKSGFASTEQQFQGLLAQAKANGVG